MNLETISAIVVVLGLLVLFKLSNIERINRAAVRGRAEEAKQAWRLHQLYEKAARLRANESTAKGYDWAMNQICEAHALIADAYDADGRQENLEALWKQQEEVRQFEEEEKRLEEEWNQNPRRREGKSRTAP